MTNREFIEKAVCLIKEGSTKNLKHKNLILKNGVLYSYGEHYPLVWKIGDAMFVNIKRYSSTTRRHSNDAYFALLEYPQKFPILLMSNDISPENIIRSVEKRLEVNKLERRREGSRAYYLHQSLIKELEDTFRELNILFSKSKPTVIDLVKALDI